MSNATTLAKRRFKTGDYSPAYTLKLAGTPLTNRLYDATASYSASDGTSELQISADAPLS